MVGDFISKGGSKGGFALVADDFTSKGEFGLVQVRGGGSLNWGLELVQPGYLYFKVIETYCLL